MIGRGLPDRSLAYVVLRLSFGVDMAMHGVNRILGGVDAFAAKLAHDFAGVHLPPMIVTPFATVLPFVELALGLAILTGALLRPAFVAGGLFMTALIFGTALKGDWSTLGIQLVYSVIYYVLLLRRADDALGVDAWRAARARRRGSVHSPA